MAKTKIFLSYSRKDQRFVGDLIKHLGPQLESTDYRCFWDQAIETGELWDQKIMDALREARVVIFFVSKNFANSAYIRQRELPIAFQGNEDGTNHLTFIELGASPIESLAVEVRTPTNSTKVRRVTELQALHKKRAVPQADGPRRDEAMQSIADEIVVLANRPTPAEIAAAPRTRPRVTVAISKDGDENKRVYYFEDEAAAFATHRSPCTSTPPNDSEIYEFLFPGQGSASPMGRLLRKLDRGDTNPDPHSLALHVVVRGDDVVNAVLSNVRWLRAKTNDHRSLVPKWVIESSIGPSRGDVVIESAEEILIAAIAPSHAALAARIASTTQDRLLRLGFRRPVMVYSADRLARCNQRVVVYVVGARRRGAGIEVELTANRFVPIDELLVPQAGIHFVHLIGDATLTVPIPKILLSAQPARFVAHLCTPGNAVETADAMIKTFAEEIAAGHSPVHGLIAGHSNTDLVIWTSARRTFVQKVPKSGNPLTAALGILPVAAILDRIDQRRAALDHIEKLVDGERQCIAAIAGGTVGNHVELIGEKIEGHVARRRQGSIRYVRETIGQTIERNWSFREFLRTVESHFFSVGVKTLREGLARRASDTDEKNPLVVILDWGAMRIGNDPTDRTAAQNVVDAWAKMHREHLAPACGPTVRVFSVIALETETEIFPEFRKEGLSQVVRNHRADIFRVEILQTMGSVEEEHIFECLETLGFHEPEISKRTVEIWAKHHGAFSATAAAIEALRESDTFEACQDTDNEG